MSSQTQIIHIQPHAPAKPPVGAACNGCGVCCLVEPCPLGIVLSRARRGACRALRWDGGLQLYRCGAMTASLEVARASLPAFLQWAAPTVARLLARLSQRWIAAGAGCDSTLSASSPSMTMQHD